MSQLIQAIIFFLYVTHASAETCYNIYHAKNYTCDYGCCGNAYDFDYGCCNLTGIIIGAVLASCFCIGCIVCLVCCCMKLKDKSSRRQNIRPVHSVQTITYVHAPLQQPGCPRRGPAGGPSGSSYPGGTTTNTLAGTSYQGAFPSGGGYPGGPNPPPYPGEPSYPPTSKPQGYSPYENKTGMVGDQSHPSYLPPPYS